MCSPSPVSVSATEPWHHLPVSEFELADDEVVPRVDLVDLYTAVGWLIYATDPEGLARAVDNSTYVVTARDDDANLIGLARCLSDDVSIMYLQDLLVHPDHQRSGIGTALLVSCMRRYGHVRQKVLLTDDEPGQLDFYRGVGFRRLDELGAPLNCFVQIRGMDRPE